MATLTALFLVTRHPGMARGLVLSDPPVVSLLDHIEGANAARDRAMLADIGTHLVAPMRMAFLAHESEAGVAVFIDYVFNDPNAWQNISPVSREEAMRNVREWEVMMTEGTFFPAISPRDVRDIEVPVLMLSGGRSYPLLRLIGDELARLLPHVRRLMIPDAGHQVWQERGALSREMTRQFLEALGERQARRE